MSFNKEKKKKILVGRFAKPNQRQTMGMLLLCCFVGVFGALRDEYCFGGASPNADLEIPPISQGKNFLTRLSPPKLGHTLKLVQMITRHGARTPIAALPGVLPVWKCSESSLSILSPNEGQQEINVSRLYRKVYLNHESYQNCAFGQLTVLGP